MVDCGSIDQREIKFHVETNKITARLTNTTLPYGWKPDSWTVICGRGKECYNHIGNRRLRVLVEANVQKYTDTKSKYQKTIIVSSIVDAVRSASKTGGFVKHNPITNVWVEVGDDLAREKIGQLLREAMVRQNPDKLNERKGKRRTQALKKARKNHDQNQSVSKSVSHGSTSSDETSDWCSCGASNESSSVADSISAKSPIPQLPSLPAEDITSGQNELTREGSMLDPDLLHLLHPLPLHAEITQSYEFDLPDLFF